MKKITVFLKRNYTYAILALFWAVAALSSQYFRTTNTFSAIFVAAVPIVIISFSQNAVVLNGGFDLSIGAIASLSTVICSYLMEISDLAAIAAVMAMGLVVGLLNGIGITKLKIEPFIMTLGMMYILGGIAQILRPTPGGYISPGLTRFLLSSNQPFALVPLLLIIVCCISGVLFFKKTAFGRRIYAIGGNEKAARMSGVNVERTRICVYMLSGVVAAIAGVYLACKNTSGNADAGSRYLFDTFTVVFMGGTLVSGGVGGFSGTVATSLIISSLVYVLQFMNVSSWYQYIIKGLLLLLVSGLQFITLAKRRNGDND
ncbi:MAG: ABC transporter permease [Candidatus Pelethousia sp.]|nr:ABC transporter permease [Candidatus Pelethousia sp.]